jgi:hypothetical protein
MPGRRRFEVTVKWIGPLNPLISAHSSAAER